MDFLGGFSWSELCNITTQHNILYQVFAKESGRRKNIKKRGKITSSDLWPDKTCKVLECEGLSHWTAVVTFEYNRKDTHADTHSLRENSLL